MSTLREAAQQALEALMWHDETVRTRGDNEAITAIRARGRFPRRLPTHGVNGGGVCGGGKYEN